MKYLNNKKMAYSSVMAAMFLGLVACGSSGSSTPATGGGGAAACNDNAGEPDIMGAITYTPATANPGDTVIMHVPVDADTAFISVILAGFSGGTVVGEGATTGTGFVTIAALGAQTVDVPVLVSNISGAGDYFATINICSVDINACDQVNGSGGVAVNYAANPVVITAPLSRFKYFANGNTIDPSFDNLPELSCVTQPVLTVVAP